MKTTIKLQQIIQIKPLFTLTLFSILSVFTMFSPSLAATYYVDATNGNDTNPGTSQFAPWKTIAIVNNSSFQPGDYILFKRGETWREQLNVPSSGSDGNPITFGAYGLGNKPIICGSDLITNWTLFNEGTSPLTVWYARINNEPMQVFFDGITGTRETAVADLDSDQEWCWFDNAIYQHSTSDPDTRYTKIGTEVGQRDYNITGSKKEYITIDGLNLVMSNISGIYNDQGNSWIVKNSTVEKYYKNGIKMRGDPIGATQIKGINILDNIIGDSNWFDALTDANTCGGINVRGSTGANILRNIVNTNNDITVGILVSEAEDDIGEPNNGADSDTPTISLNNINGGGIGIRIEYTKDAEISYNHIDGEGKEGAGIHVQRTSTGAVVKYNVIHDFTWVSGVYYGLGIDVNIGSINGFAYNNTVYKVGAYCMTLEALFTACTGWTVRNNIFNASKNTPVNGVAAGMFLDVGVGNHVTLSNNIYVPNSSVGDGDGVVNYEGTLLGTLKNLTELQATGDDTNSFDSDPLFTNAESEDFTLQAGSPAINAGMDLGANYDDALYYTSSWPDSVVTVDQDNFGCGWEVGAYVKTPLYPPLNFDIVNPTVR